jgi:obg-like ATPase 1
VKLFRPLGAFDDPDVTHVEGEVDPIRDLDIICEELRLKDQETLNKNLEKLEKLVVRGNDKKLKPEYVSSNQMTSLSLSLSRISMSLR